jgi:hypothetical protein
MALKAGTIPDPNDSEAPSLAASLAGSMAKAMEDAFVTQWPNVMGERDLPEDRQQMQLMFVAVAQGVVEHLRNNPDAFKVEVTLSSGDSTAEGEVTKIEIE